MTLRIYADFNSGGLQGEPCWCLRYGTARTPLDDLADELELTDGMPVILFCEDPAEEFEVSATLRRHEESVVRWQALPDWRTMRRIR